MSQSCTLIKNGLVIDGTGAEPFQANVLVQDKQIVAVGTDAASHASADASITDRRVGLQVLPGMIDSHCHISFDHLNSNDELFFHRRYGLAALVAGVNAQKVLRAGFTSFFDADCVFMSGLTSRCHRGLRHRRTAHDYGRQRTD